MFISFLNRTSRRNQILSNLSTIRHQLLSTSAAGTSDLYLKYSFKPPSSFNRNLNPNPNSKPQPRTKPKKTPYRPPSSLDRSGKKPLRSTLPFDFQFSYTESSPDVRPIGLREPKYSPFGPDRVDRVWTGVCAPAVDPKLGKEAAEKVVERRRKMRENVQGEELTEAEKKVIVDSCHRHKTKKQINLGRDGLTHNMLNDIHNNWKHAEAVRIKCMGVPTVDMKNICAQLEDKAFGKVIHRHGSLLILYRGRNYDPKKRPVIPVMMWKPKEPIYPKLIKTTIEGLSIEETKEMRKKGLAVPALTKLAKNGYYACLVPMVRDAFLVTELVRIDCRGLEAKDYKKIGCKLRDLVPCILVTFDKEQIVIWRGKNYKPKDSGYIFSDEEMFDTPSNNMTTDTKRQIPDDFRTQVDFDSGQEE